MIKHACHVSTKPAGREHGQVLILVAFAAVVMVAIVGLVMDVGVMFIGNARLRRAVDAAALAAALQYRQNSDIASLTRSANEFLVLNGITNPHSTVTNCDSSGDPELCTTPRRKLVKVHATAEIKTAFLQVIGIDTVPISATAVSETASLDVVLVIDTSESMTYGTDLSNQLDATDPMRDPAYCNSIPSAEGNAGSCEPFNHVINAAVDFTQNMSFFPYDHVAIVTFDREPHTKLSLMAGDNSHDVISTLRSLTVYQGEGIYKTGTSPDSPYLCYGQVTSCFINGAHVDLCQETPDYTNGVSNYKGLLGRGQDPCLPGYVNPPDPSHYTTTNIGGALQLAGNEFTSDSRQDALWVVILLTDGVANAGFGGSVPSYYCPQSTWGNLPRCNDMDIAADLDPASRPAMGSGSYDASDFAYDMADFVGLPYPKGQFALLYTIGLGPEVTKYTGQPGKTFLDYAANVGRGQSFYTTSSADLLKIFRLIGSNIATRLSK